MGKAAIRSPHAKSETHPPRGKLSVICKGGFKRPTFETKMTNSMGTPGMNPRIVGAAFLIVVLGLAFSVGHQPTRVASNDNVNSPITTPAAPPSNPMTAPGLTPPPATPN
jgi:hypothetical protein